MSEPRRFPTRPSGGVLLGFTAGRLLAIGAAGLVVIAGVLAGQAAGLLVALPPAVVLVIAAFVPYGGMTLVEWVPTLLHFHGRQTTGQTTYLSRLPFQTRPAGTCGLSGDAAALRYVIDIPTGAAFVHDPHRKTLTAVLAVSHPAFVLLDGDDQDQRVSRWDRCQSALAHSGTVAALQVLEAVVPDRGDGPAEWYAAHGVRNGGWADLQYQTLLAETKLQATQHRTTVSLALDMSTAARAIKAAGGGISGAATVLRQDMTQLAEELRQSGIRVHHLLTEGELAAIVRSAYDPATSLDPRCDPGANLATAGPMFIEERKDCLHSDSGWSTVLWIVEWPRVGVRARTSCTRWYSPRACTAPSVSSRGPLPTVRSLRQIRREKVAKVTDARQKARIGQVADYGDQQEHADVLAQGNVDPSWSPRRRVPRSAHRDRPGARRARGVNPADRPGRRLVILRGAGSRWPTSPRVRARRAAVRPDRHPRDVPAMSGPVPTEADTPENGRFVTVDMDALTSDDVRTLLAVVLEREARQLQDRDERVAKANELLSQPTIGAYRQRRQTQGIEQ